MTKQSSQLSILFADICKSSQIYEILGDRTAQDVIGNILDRLSEATMAFDGKVIKMIGDAVMCTFPSAENAVKAARAMQKSMAHKLSDNPDLPSINIHIGLHHGPVIIEDGDVFGDAVNLASRLVDYAKPRQIITSKSTLEKLPADLKHSAKYIADITVKNISGEIKVYEIVWESQDLTVIMSRRKPSESQRLRLDLLIDNKIIVVDNQNQTVSIGRQGYNDIVIDYSWISRTHAYIEYRKGVFMVVDKSSNGTFVYPNEAKPICINMAERPLSGSGVIIIGREKSDETHNDTIQYAIKSVDGQ